MVETTRYHRDRRGKIARAHPEVKALYGQAPAVAVLAILVAAAQFALAWWLALQPWWLIVLAAVGLGGFATHFLNVVIHESAHNLVLRSPALNRAVAIIANLPGVVPSAMAFRHYHLLHHRHLGERGADADAPMAWEVALVGRGPWRKALWLLAQPLFYAVIHPAQVRERVALDRWLVANIVVVLGATALVFFAWGWGALLYLALSAYFAIGPHPTGAHTIQEHFAIGGREETASYYGPVNLLSINHGLHLEHHDFPNIPGWRLARLRRLAPQFYGGRFAYRSRLASLWRFVADGELALDSRVIRAAEPNITSI